MLNWIENGKIITAFKIIEINIMSMRNVLREV